MRPVKYEPFFFGVCAPRDTYTQLFAQFCQVAIPEYDPKRRVSLAWPSNYQWDGPLDRKAATGVMLGLVKFLGKGEAPLEDIAFD